MRYLLLLTLAVLPISACVAQADDVPPIPKLNKEYVVRIAYLIPKNREPRPAVIQNIQKLLPWFQQWYAEQMDRHGYGPKTFQLETAPGNPPPVHLVRIAGLDSDYHTRANAAQTREHLQAWTKLIDAAQAAGVPVKTRGQVWLLAYELHQQRPDGTVAGRLNRGGQFGTNEHSGVGTAVTTLLGMADEAGMSITADYDSMTVPDVGPHVLHYGKSFETYAGGKTLGGIVSGEAASMLHELSHGFGLQHNRRNDNGREGNLMGAGYRGIRSEIYARRFPGEAVNLSPASAAVLNVNRHFNADRAFTDDVPPVIGTAEVSPRITDGNIVATVTARDDRELAFATFSLNSNVDGDSVLTGTRQTATLKSYHYKAGETAAWEIRVFDAQGNKAVKRGTFAIPPSEPHAPIPIIKAAAYTVRIGQPLSVDALASFDPDSPRLLVEWDTDGDGAFDTPPDAERKTTVTFTRPGVHKVRARIRDDRHQTISEPILIRVAK